MAKKISALKLLTAAQTDDDDRVVGTDVSVPETKAWKIAELVKLLADRLASVFIKAPDAVLNHTLVAFEGTSGRRVHATDVTHQDLGRTLATGLIEGGIVTIAADPTKFIVAAGSGIVVDSATDPLEPTVTRVAWSARTIALTDPAFGRTYVSINASGGVVQSRDWSESQARDLILLARLAHVGGAITTAAMRPTLAYGLGGRLNDLADAIGPLNVSGNLVTPIAGSLHLARSAGVIFRVGANYVADRASPNIIQTPAQSPMTWLVQYRDGAGGWKRTLGQDAVNPNQWDDGSGTLAAVHAQKWTIQRVWHFSSGVTVLAPGQKVFASVAECDANRTRSDFVFDRDSYGPNAVLLGWLMVQQGTTDLANTTKAVWVQASKFGG